MGGGGFLGAGHVSPAILVVMSAEVCPMDVLLTVRKLFQEVGWAELPGDQRFQTTSAGRFAKGMDVVVSFPAAYGDAWGELVRISELLGPAGFAATGHWLAEDAEGYGIHDYEASGKCHCHHLYGKQQDWGCRWYTMTQNNIRLAHQKGCNLIFVTKIDGSIGATQRQESSFLASQGMRVRIVAMDEFAVEMTAKQYGLADDARQIFDMNPSDKIDFLGSSDKGFELANVAIVSYPGVHGHGWNQLTKGSLKEGSMIATSCVFLPTEASPGYGEHAAHQESGHWVAVKELNLSYQNGYVYSEY